MKHIVIHCSATRPDQLIGAKEIDAWHRQRGFSRIGYNYVIRRDGKLESGRREGDELAHAAGFNEDAIAVCLVGGLTEDGEPSASFTRAQWRALRIVIDFMLLKYPQAELLGHRDLPGVNKDCPCFDVRRWWDSGEIMDARKPDGPQ